MSQDPYTNYNNQPQDFYQHEPLQNPDETSQSSYTTPPPYGYGQQQQNYEQQQQQQSYASPPPQATPLPLEQAIQELPSQYVKVLKNSSKHIFTQEMGKASWNIVWAQLIGYAVVSAILSYLVSLIIPNPFLNIFGTTTSNPIVIQLIHWGLTLGLAPLIILSFFIGNGISYLMVKIFQGKGTFLAQSYTGLLYGIPLGILSVLISRVPLLGGFIALGIGIYKIVLQIFSIMAVHRLSGGKATAVVLLSIASIAVSLFFILLLFVFIVVLMVGIGIIPFTR